LQISYGFTLLQLFKKLDLESDKLLTFIIAECNPKNAIKKSEVNHFIFAKLLCFYALIQSGKIEGNMKVFEVIQEHLV
jgi:hypothetical protein